MEENIKYNFNIFSDFSEKDFIELNKRIEIDSLRIYNDNLSNPNKRDSVDDIKFRCSFGYPPEYYLENKLGYARHPNIREDLVNKNGECVEIKTINNKEVTYNTIDSKLKNFIFRSDAKWLYLYYGNWYKNQNDLKTGEYELLMKINLQIYKIYGTNLRFIFLGGLNKIHFNYDFYSYYENLLDSDYSIEEIKNTFFNNFGIFLLDESLSIKSGKDIIVLNSSDFKKYKVIFNNEKIDDFCKKGKDFFEITDFSSLFSKCNFSKKQINGFIFDEYFDENIEKRIGNVKFFNIYSNVDNFKKDKNFHSVNGFEYIIINNQTTATSPKRLYETFLEKGNSIEVTEEIMLNSYNILILPKNVY